MITATDPTVESALEASVLLSDCYRAASFPTVPSKCLRLLDLMILRHPEPVTADEVAHHFRIHTADVGKLFSRLDGLLARHCAKSQIRIDRAKIRETRVGRPSHRYTLQPTR